MRVAHKLTYGKNYCTSSINKNLNSREKSIVNQTLSQIDNTKNTHKTNWWVIYTEFQLKIKLRGTISGLTRCAN